MLSGRKRSLMNNTSENKESRLKITVLAVLIMFASIFSGLAIGADGALTLRQQNIVPIAAFTAGGELDRLVPALNKGLDEGLSINEIKEVMVHLYAYTGFPRSLNALNTLR